MIGQPRGTTKDTSSLRFNGPAFWTMYVRVPASGRVAIPGAYPHEYASMPLYWKHVETTAKYVAVPILQGQITLDRG